MSESSKRLLSLLMVLGAQSPEKALASKELAAKLGVGEAEVDLELRKLVEGGYAAMTGQPGLQKAYLTGTGVITASSTYS